MRLDTARGKQLDAYLSDKPAVEDGAIRVQVAGSTEKYRAYRIPIKYLIFNIRNGRFAAELLETEARMRRKLDPTVDADSKIIRKLLLDQNRTETEELKASIRKDGQLESGIITFDGAVINANRRMAVLQTLFEETHEPKFECLTAARLPAHVDERDLWRIEAGIQFAKDFQLEYGPVNELLKLKEGLHQGLSAEDISASLLGRFSPKKVKEKIAILKLIDSYLGHIRHPGEYHLIQRHVEKFNSLQANVVAPLQRKGRPGTEVADIITVAFTLIHKVGDDSSHWEIRKLHKIAMNNDARKELAPILAEKSSVEAIQEAFTAAKEVFEDSESKDKPERLAKRALTAIKSISPKSPKISSPAVQAMLKELAGKVQSLLKAR